jgi:polysaccharide export outer membrane protein
VQGVPSLPEQLAILSRQSQNMIRFVAIRHGGACVSGLALAAVLAAGCSVSSIRRDLDLADSHPGPASAGDLMSAHDRQALAGVSTARMQAGAGGYRIGPDDLLDVRIPKLLAAQATDAPHTENTGATMPAVAGAPVFQEGLRVAADGDIALPSIGSVRAAGLTPAELEAEISRRLVAGGILLHPNVSVQIAEHRSSVVAVMGSVERPGLYPLTRPDATVADLVWAAGGPNKDAGRVVEFTPAGEQGGGAPIRIDVEVLAKDRGGLPTAENPPARAGDVITLRPAGSVLVDGWVDKPGSYPVTRGLTLSGAVAAAGGHLFAADRQNVAVKRVLAGGQQQSFTVDLDAIASGHAPDVPITDGDVVHLPMSAARAVPWSVYEVGKEAVHISGYVPLF